MILLECNVNGNIKTTLKLNISYILGWNATFKCYRIYISQDILKLYFQQDRKL